LNRPALQRLPRSFSRQHSSCSTGRAPICPAAAIHCSRTTSKPPGLCSLEGTKQGRPAAGFSLFDRSRVPVEWSLIKQISLTRRMFEKPRCKCPRCVAGRRNLGLAIFGICVVMALAYLMITDHGETLRDPIWVGSGPLISDSRLDRPQNASGGSKPLSTTNGAVGSTRQQEPVVVEKLPDSHPEQDPSLDSTSLNLTTPMLDENLAMVFGSHPFSVLPSWLGEREFDAPWRPQGGSADEVTRAARQSRTEKAKVSGP
jgi:hypothetical protein